MKRSLFFFLAGILSLSSCTPDSHVPPNPNRPTIFPTFIPAFFQASINGDEVTFNKHSGNQVKSVNGLKPLDFTQSMSVRQSEFYQIDGQKQEPSKVRFTYPFTKKMKGQFEANDYFQGQEAFKTNGLAIEYIDKDQKLWTLFNGSGDQTDSYFEITSTASNSDKSNLEIKGLFQCKLYDRWGNVLELKNGSFKVQVPL